MNKEQLKRTKLFYELIDYVNELKENSDEIYSFSSNMFNKAETNFEKQNDKVFNINLYILIRLYKDEYKKIKKAANQFTLNEYYDFVESIEITDFMREFYIRMPEMVGKNKMLSYVTDIPSFINMIR